MKFLVALCMVVMAHPMFAQGPLVSSGAREVARLASDVSLSSAVVLNGWNAAHESNRWEGLGCDALRNSLAYGSVAASQHWIHSTRPSVSTQTGYGMWSGHTTMTAVNFDRNHPLVSVATMAVTYLGRTLSGEHTPAQALLGLGVGLGVSFVPCGGSR